MSDAEFFTPSALDTLYVNLKVIASLKPDMKLVTTTGQFLGIETPAESYFSIPMSLHRRIRGDDRNQTILKLDNVITQALAYIGHYSENLPMMIELAGAAKGIINLKETYGACIQTVARIDTLLDKIQEYIDFKAPIASKDQGVNF